MKKILAIFFIAASLLRGAASIVGGEPASGGKLAVGVFPLSMCGQEPSATQEVLRALFFNGNSTRATVERMFSTCSFNKSQLDEGRSRVMPLEELPCSGTLTIDDTDSPRNITFDFSKQCGDNELNTMLYFAKQRATSKTWNELDRIVVVIPDLPCDWSGWGITGGSTSWVKSPKGSVMDITLIFHEMMHNTGLDHSERLQLDRTAVAQGEDPDPMGGGVVDSEVADGILCTNAPQAWKAGWAAPIAVNMTSMEPGVLSTYTLPSLATSGGVGAMLRVVMYDDGLTDDNQQRALFVSYRARTPAPGFDSALPEVWDQKVYLHQYDGVGVPRAEPMTTPTYLLGLLDALEANVTEPPPGASLPVRRSWVYTPLNQVDVLRPDLRPIAGALGSLKISFVAKNRTHATVSLCRFFALTESGSMCSDGVVNDCDGVSDDDDPDCQDGFRTSNFADSPSQPPSKGRSPRPPPPRAPPSPLAKALRPRPPPRSPRPPPATAQKKKSPPPPKKVLLTLVGRRLLR